MKKTKLELRKKTPAEKGNNLPVPIDFKETMLSFARQILVLRSVHKDEDKVNALAKHLSAINKAVLSPSDRQITNIRDNLATLRTLTSDGILETIAKIRAQKEALGRKGLLYFCQELMKDKESIARDMYFSVEEDREQYTFEELNALHALMIDIRNLPNTKELNENSRSVFLDSPETSDFSVSVEAAQQFDICHNIMICQIAMFNIIKDRDGTWLNETADLIKKGEPFEIKGLSQNVFAVMGKNWQQEEKGTRPPEAKILDFSSFTSKKPDEVALIKPETPEYLARLVLTAGSRAANATKLTHHKDYSTITVESLLDPAAYVMADHKADALMLLSPFREDYNLLLKYWNTADAQTRREAMLLLEEKRHLVTHHADQARIAARKVKEMAAKRFENNISLVSLLSPIDNASEILNFSKKILTLLPDNAPERNTPAITPTKAKILSFSKDYFRQ